MQKDSGSVRPETISQAVAWERVKKSALEFGLCPPCAAQLAWGHAVGFATVHPPCPSCTAVVRRLPVARLNGWRTVAGTAADQRSWTALSGNDRAGGPTHAVEAVVHVGEAHTRGQRQRREREV